MSRLADACLLSLAIICAARCPAAAATPQNDPAPAQAGTTTTAPGASHSAGSLHIIKGTVTAQDTGQPIAHVTVSLHRNAEARGKEVETDAAGAFEFKDVKPGDYTLTFAGEGMLASTRSVHLKNEPEPPMNVALEPMETADVLRITGQRMLTHPEQMANTTHLDKKYLDQLGNGNDLRQVIQTTPGIMPDSLGNIITRGEHDSVNYTLDGAVIPETAGVLQQGQLASPRSLQAVDVNIGGYEAGDGGGPMGAIVHMKSMPIQAKPVFTLGTQLGGPISGGLNYYLSSALSQDPNSKWNHVRFESSGSIFASKLGLNPGTSTFRRDAKIDMNSMTKLVWEPTERDRFTLIASINESYAHQPVSPISRAAGVKIDEHDRQNYIMLSYKHRFKKFFDEGNLHLINSFYSQHIWQPNVFDPNPVINGDNFIQSAAVNAKRYNYVISAQGDVTKTVFKTHALKAGFLTNLRFTKTQLSEYVYDANPADSTYGQIISPFTQAPGGPNFTGNMGKYHGSQWVQSAYIEDTWRPEKGWLKRLTLNYGARFDLADSLFGNAMGIAETINTIPGVSPFNIAPFQRQTQINAQVSGRYGGTYALNKTTILRASFSNIFVPNPVDYFLTPFNVTSGPYPFNGIFNGAPRPLQAMRGRLVDAGVEKQFGKRFVMRNNVFYKKLYHFGDSGVIDNSIVYNRLTNNEQEAYGAETRLELKPSRDGTGFYGYVSNTFAVAYLRGTRNNDGEFWFNGPASTTKYPDHDRRDTVSAALGYRSKRNFWILATVNAYTGVKNEEIFYPHPARVPPACFIGLTAGMPVPAKIKRDHRYCPDSIEVRIENLTNNVAPINLGSPYQGTRYALPIRVLACTNWKIL